MTGPQIFLQKNRGDTFSKNFLPNINPESNEFRLLNDIFLFEYIRTSTNLGTLIIPFWKISKIYLRAFKDFFNCIFKETIFWVNFYSCQIFIGSLFLGFCANLESSTHSEYFRGQKIRIQNYWYPILCMTVKKIAYNRLWVNKRVCKEKPKNSFLSHHRLRVTWLV